jgi:acetyl-CoA synthetase
MLHSKSILDQLAEPGNVDISVPEFFNFGFDVIDTWATEEDTTAFVSVNRTATVIKYHSFSELSRASNCFANALQTLGVERGARAILILPRITVWFEVVIGFIKTGIVAIPGTNLLTAKDIEYRINHSAASLVIVSTEHTPKIESIRTQCPSLRHLIVVGDERNGWINYADACAEESGVFDRKSIPLSRSDDMMMAYFTSGTTSWPKMVPRNHGYSLAHIVTGKFWMDLQESDVHWTLSDTGWAKAAWGMLFPQWLIGATIVLYDGDPKFDPEIHLRLIDTLGVTTFCAPPTVYRVFAQMDLSEYRLTSLRHSMSAGEPLNPEAIRMWKNATDTFIHDGYGQTETVNIIANVPGMDIRPGSMGKPVPGFDVKIVDDDGTIVADNQIGHIAVRLTHRQPLGLFDGYYEGPDALNCDSFQHGWYYTGDTATRDSDGYIWFVGRSDDIITSAGYKISPFEVESALLEHPAVAESAVVEKPDDLRGGIVKAHIVLATGYTASRILMVEIQEYVKKTTAPYKYPREIQFQKSLPKTISGKIRRVDLREKI